MELEIKGLHVHRDGKSLIRDFSLIAETGKITCLQCESALWPIVSRTILGLQPMEKGYISFDGELLTTKSAPYFRRQIAYLPQDLRLSYETLGELLDVFCRMKVNGEKKLRKSAILEAIGLDENAGDTPLKDISYIELRMILLRVLRLQQRPIMLVEGWNGNDDELTLLRAIADEQTTVVVNCSKAVESAKINQIVVLNPQE